MLVSGNAGDLMDQYFKVGETTAREILGDFCDLVITFFGNDYLNRCPSEAEKVDILELMKLRGFPGAFASWDCKHFVWKNCPTGLAGQHQDHKSEGETNIGPGGNR